ncbi:ABC transporter substrate-binding protein [Glycomyces xiaoerkulensis]|uniref:ABC transporter substrate-binding protein n=1 Tax=Glycomyces xiaoerkulensis TaxID=2038139 RepID=UPI0012FFD6C9|nr:extracellular solute-binding protein [Glycomyces xiaoerkulensis]
MKSFNPSQGLSRRTLAKAGLLGAGAAPLAACGGGDDGGGGDSSEIEFMWWGSDPRHEYTQQIIDAFEAANDGVSVKPNPGEWSSYWDNLSVAVSGGNSPDVMQQEERYLRYYASQGALAAMEDIGVDLSEIDEGALSGGQIDGKTYGVATGVNAMTVMANPAVFDEAGVPLPDDTTWTWQDFVDIAVEINDATGKFGTQSVFVNNEAVFNIFARQHGQSLYSPDGGLGFDTEVLAEYYDFLLGLVGSGGSATAAEIVEFESAGQDQAPFATGDAGMAMYWTNQLSAISEVLGSEVRLLRIPGESEFSNKGMYLKPAMFWAAAAEDSNANAETSGKLVDFLLNSEESLDLMLTDRGMPSNLTQRERIVPMLEDADAQSADFLAEITPDLEQGPPVPPIGAADVPDIAKRIGETMLAGELGAAEAAEQFVTEAEAAIGE